MGRVLRRLGGPPLRPGRHARRRARAARDPGDGLHVRRPGPRRALHHHVAGERPGGRAAGRPAACSSPARAWPACRWCRSRGDTCARPVRDIATSSGGRTGSADGMTSARHGGRNGRDPRSAGAEAGLRDVPAARRGLPRGRPRRARDRLPPHRHGARLRERARGRAGDRRLRACRARRSGSPRRSRRRWPPPTTCAPRARTRCGASAPTTSTSSCCTGRPPTSRCGDDGGARRAARRGQGAPASA